MPENDMQVNQKKTSIILSYLNLAVSMVVNIFLTPLMISHLGDVDYSIYKVMQSFAGPLGIFHLGISTIVTRSIVKCKTTPDYTENDKKNTMALALLTSFAMSVIVAVAGLIMCGLIPSVYGEKYDADTIKKGQLIFLIFVFSAIIHMMTDAFSGTIIGHEKFAISSGITLCKSIIKIVLTYIFLKAGATVLFVVLVDLIIAVAAFLYTAFYSIGILKEIPQLTVFDSRQVWEIFTFGSAILLQAIVNQVNNNVDTMILGAKVDDKAIITMYSSALAIYSVYNSLISAITNLFLPKATKLVTENASGKELTDFVIKPGRFQAVLAVGCILGFALCGRNFITIWIGSKYIDAYWIVLLLMIPVTIPLVENAAVSLLDASLKRIFRSIVLVGMAVINVTVSLVLVSWIGYWGAAIGTAFSLVIGHGVIMNVYYAKTFNMEIWRMFSSIFKGILPAGLAAAVLCIPLCIFLEDNLAFFFVKAGGFSILYFAFLCAFGITKDEKKILFENFMKDK